MDTPGLTDIHTFIGNSGPVFYYNLIEKPRAPHVARIVLELQNAKQVEPAIEWIDRRVASQYPEVDVVAKKIGQGPPIDSPIEIKVFSEDRQLLADAVQRVQKLLQATPGTRAVRNDLGLGLMKLNLKPRDDVLARNGLTRAQLASAVSMRSTGLTLGQYHGADDPIAIIASAPTAVDYPMAHIGDMEIRVGGRALRLDALADIELEWMPASIHHYNLQRTASVFSETAANVTYNDVLKSVQTQLDQLPWPAGTRYSLAGAAKESGEANQSLTQALPIGVIMLLMFLLIEFNSMRKTLIILITVPLAFAGVPIGLLLTGTSFGFTATLGVLSLIGIVVNNAIVLLDLIHKNSAEGMSHIASIENAVSRRTRPIILTTLTTVFGLLPLVTTDSTLWPPLAWSIISGLTVSTALSLLVVPAMYRLMLQR